MKKIRDKIKSEHFQTVIKPEIGRFIAVIVFTIIYGIGLKFFLEQAAVRMYTGGIPGIAQLLSDFLIVRMGVTINDQDLFMAIVIIIINIPVLTLGWLGVSKKFTIYSLVSVIIQATIIGFIPSPNLGLNGMDHNLTNSILGGLLIGAGIGGALKYGTSTGGFDILAQYFSLKKGGKSVGTLSMAMNVTIAILGGLTLHNSVGANGDIIVAGSVISYTILRILITTIATDKIHTSYQYLELEIVTENEDNIEKMITERTVRGVTVNKSYGAFSGRNKKTMKIVILSYELESMLKLIKELDPSAFIVAKPVRKVIGNFTRKTIA